MGVVPGLRRGTALEGDKGNRVRTRAGLRLPVTAGRLSRPGESAGEHRSWVADTEWSFEGLLVYRERSS